MGITRPKANKPMSKRRRTKYNDKNFHVQYFITAPKQQSNSAKECQHQNNVAGGLGRGPSQDPGDPGGHIILMLALFCIVWLLLWSCEEVVNVEVLIIVLCPSSLAHWLVGFWSGDSQMFFFLFLCFFLFFFCFFLFLVFWLVFSFCFFFVFIFVFLSFWWFPVIACFCWS